MKTIVIIGGTREAARKRLEKIAPDNGVVSRDWHDEVEMDGHRIVAIGGSPDDVCLLRNVGFTDVMEIITVEPDNISPEMKGRINQILSTTTVYHYVGGKRYERQLQRRT